MIGTPAELRYDAGMQITCPRCKVEQDVSEFALARTKANGRQSYCKSCGREMKRDWVAKNRETVREQDREYRRKRIERDEQRERDVERRGYLRYMFNITMEQYDAMFEAQGGLCGICKEPPTATRRLAIDHDRKCCPTRKCCGKCIRGLLCTNCNPRLGFYETFENEVNAWRTRAYVGSVGA